MPSLKTEEIIGAEKRVNKGWKNLKADLAKAICVCDMPNESNCYPLSCLKAIAESIRNLFGLTYAVTWGEGWTD